jgi:hypothetical protein
MKAPQNKKGFSFKPRLRSTYTRRWKGLSTIFPETSGQEKLLPFKDFYVKKQVATLRRECP